MDNQVREVVDQVRLVYDDIHELQRQRNQLSDARAAAAMRDAVLERGRKLLEATEQRVRNLQQELDALQIGPEPALVSPELVINSPPAVGSENNCNATHTGAGESPDQITPALPERQGQRAEITNLVGRFLRYQLSTEDQAQFEQFNALMNDESRPVGEALALLDFEVAYETPFGKREQNSPEKWVARLQQWGMELERYRTTLIGDIGVLRRRYSNLLGIVDRYRDRAAHPERWNDWLEAAQRDQEAKVAEAEALASDLRRQIEVKYREKQQ